MHRRLRCERWGRLRRLQHPCSNRDDPLFYSCRISSICDQHTCFVDLEQIRYHSRPAGLMAGADTVPAITVEVLVERNVIAPMRIVLKGHVGAKDCPAALLVTQKDICEPPSQLFRHLP